MGCCLSLLLLLAPDDPAQLLRVAWASQYEWAEDKVQNATLDFRYTYVWGDKGEFTLEGQGHVVVVGDRIRRRHYPDLADDAARARLDGHVEWILARFVRPPFEEAFKDVPLAGPERSAFDQLKITAGGRAFYVKGDRLVAEERNVGSRDRPQIARVEYRVAEMGGGYAIAGESLSYTRASDTVKVTQERSLTTRVESERPAPALYSYEEKSSQSRERLTIDVHTVRFDLADPVTIDPAARDALKAAWATRHVLPEDIRIQGQFQRSVDKELDRAGWRGDVRGDFQVWGMNSVQLTLDERAAGETERTCTDHVRWIFGLLRDAPFEEEFKECGFEIEAEGAETVVRVYGYPKAMAFRIAGGSIAGHYDRVLSEWGWWSYRSKATGEGRFQIERMRREVEGKKVEIEFDYQRVGGHSIPKKFGVLATPRTPRGDVAVGVVEYSFRKPKVSFP